ncbi:MAG: VWA domain-containing protein, partial [Chloroflexi bacterium]|nr:VWA domain-containing protein [Chloroflexota bacterium]
MKYKFFAFLIVLSILLSACTPAASTEEPEAQVETVVETVVVTKEVEGSTVEVVITATSSSSEDEPAQEPVPQATAPADNFFEDYGVNPYTDTSEDNLSTFAIDVDTASYSVARRYVQDGNMPPADAIRVEEFVNYFNQGYPTPPDVAFGLYADGAPSPFHND